MTFPIRNLALITAVCISAVLGRYANGQDSAKSSGSASEFDVASVRIARNSRTPEGWLHSSVNSPNPGQFAASNATLQECIEWAYRLKEYQVVGPSWIRSERYNILAKAAPYTPGPVIRTLAQNLLTSRFRMRVRRETRMMKMYALVLPPGGPNLTKAEEEAQPRITLESTRLTSERMTLPRLAEILSRQTGQIVVDKTGVTGFYRIKLEYSDAGDPDASGPGIFEAVQKQLGIRVERQTGPVEMLVVEHADKIPTEN